MAAQLHISISAEKLFSIGGFEVTNSILTSLIVSGLLIAFAVAVRSSLTATNRPSGLQNVAEWIIESLYNLIHGVTGSDKKTRHFFPLVATFFLFIALNNWLGLLPGVGTIGMEIQPDGSEEHAQLLPSSLAVTAPEVAQVQAATEVDTHAAVDETHAELEASEHSGAEAAGEEAHAEGSDDAHGSGPIFVPYFRAGTADINTTLALALISVVMTQVIGVKFLGLAYFKKFFNFSDPIMFFVGILELISEFGKILSYAFRLFGNIFAGEVLLVVVSALAYVVVPMPFYGLEVFVGFIQGLVFALLSTVFFNLATMSHDDH